MVSQCRTSNPVSSSTTSRSSWSTCLTLAAGRLPPPLGPLLRSPRNLVMLLSSPCASPSTLRISSGSVECETCYPTYLASTCVAHPACQVVRCSMFPGKVPWIWNQYLPIWSSIFNALPKADAYEGVSDMSFYKLVGICMRYSYPGHCQ